MTKIILNTEKMYLLQLISRNTHTKTDYSIVNYSIVLFWGELFITVNPVQLCFIFLLSEDTYVLSLSAALQFYFICFKKQTCTWGPTFATL